MVDIEETVDEMGNPLIRISNKTKKKIVYSIRKTRDGYAMYEITVDKGVFPKALSGKFLKSMDAQRKIIQYLELQPVSSTVKRDEMKERMIESKEKGL